MKGSNELHLNQATIIEAIQEYLDKRYTPKPRVVSVSTESKGYGEKQKFTVIVEELVANVEKTTTPPSAAGEPQ